MHSCAYTVGDLSLVPASVPDVYWAGQLACPPSILWFCVECGTVYARLYVEGAKQWKSVAARCESCTPTIFTIPGSIIPIWPDELFKALPLEVLEWEFRCHVKWFDSLYGEQEMKEETHAGE